MQKYFNYFVLNFLVFLACGTIGVISASPALAFDVLEPPRVLKASEILPRSFFQSELYSVNQDVNNDGLMNTYRVTSKHGNFAVISTVALYKLIVEIEAINAMKEVEQSESFTKALKESGISTVEGIKNLFANPEESIVGAGKGLTGIFSRAQESIFKSNPGETEDSRVKQLVGFSQSKREIAHKYNVDVYSTNQVLQEHLDNLAWADYAGGIALSIATLPVGGPAKVVYSSSNVVRLLNEAIALTPPSELKVQNREKLTKMNIDINLIDLFIDNPHFSPRQQSYLVASMEALTEAENRDVVLMVALQANAPDLATAITTMVMMSVGYNNNVSKIKKLYPVERIMGCLDANGNKVLLLPVDHLTWNARLVGVLKEMIRQQGSTPDQIWLLGTASKYAQEKLKENGLKVQAKVADKIGVNELGFLKKE